MGFDHTIEIDDRGRKDTWELDGVVLEPDQQWLSYAPQMPPAALSVASMRSAIRAIQASSGSAPDRVVCSPAQLDAINDMLAGDVTKTVCEEE
jgi:hypothetical protein